MTDLSSVRDKRIVITGTTSGIGRASALRLAEAGAVLTMLNRSEEKSAAVVEDIRKVAPGAQVDVLALDLTSLESVRAATAELLADERPIDVLLNNAGVAGQRGATKEGFELAFGVNHLGHFLLTAGLLERLLERPAPRVVTVASRAHYDTRGVDLDAVQQSTPSITGLKEYAVSKLANVIFARSLAERYGDQGLLSFSLHPGVVATEAWRRIPTPIAALMKAFMLNEDKGARTSLHCVAAPGLEASNGAYFSSSRVKKPNPAALDTQLAEELWTRSVEWTGARWP